jgi:hypothetical protein
MKTRNPWWLCILALSLLPVSAQAEKGSGENEGVPFQLLQQQLDALSQRVGALEAARAPGQSCQAGQFVAAITATGVIVCATPATAAGGAGGAGGTTAGGGAGAGGTTPPPGTVTDAFRAALQQAFSALSGNNVPLAPTTLAIPLSVVVPTSYDLAIGTVVLAVDLPSATATITAAIPTFVWRADASTPLSSGAATFSANPGTTAVITVSVENTPTGKHRLGTVMSTQLNLAFTVTGPGAAPFTIIDISGVILDEYGSILGGLVPQALATLPEF